MSQLMLLDSTNDLYVCGGCKLVFTYLPLFLEHKKQLCTKTVGSEESMNHVEENVINLVAIKQCEPSTLRSDTAPSNAEPGASSSNDLQCNVCKKSFEKVKSLLVHLKTHSGKPYQCLICGRCFNQNTHLQRHELSHKVWPEGLSKTTAKTTGVDVLSYSCVYCDKIFSNYNQFRSHLKLHVTLKKFKCVQGDCIGLFESIEDIIHHVSTKHKEPLYVCHICNKKFATLDEIASHQQNTCEVTKDARNKDFYKCSQCDATFKRKGKLVLHLSLETHRKTCVHCNKTFTSDKRLRLHLQIHQNVKPFQCIICGQSFHLKKYLSAHMLKHGERQFTCKVCNKKFKRKDLLQRHMKLHSNRKVLKCPFNDSLDCKREFTRNDKLKLHIKHHTKQLTGLNEEKSPRKTASSTMEILIIPLSDDGY